MTGPANGAALPPGNPAIEDRLVVVRGLVQGVGFRPYVARLAATWGLRGWVRNDVHGVEVRVAGSPDRVAAFVAKLPDSAPPAARVREVQSGAVPATAGIPPLPVDGFTILASAAGAAPPTAGITPDLALCAECRRELADPADRRSGYPFINCTQCGPRYSIIEALPYDRARTTMAGFTMCPDCRCEYEDPADRRHHAEPNACAACGPRVALQEADGRIVAGGGAAIRAAAGALRAGRIVAVKGIGGYHLMVDAADASAVAELRRRKHREEKPFAVMFPSLAELRASTEPLVADVRWLESATAPIVLVRRRAGSHLAEAVAPGNPWVGALLPYSPLHVLLLAEAGRPLVATSGNLAEEPLCCDDAEARARLGGIADLFLVHDRPIARPVDDSVLRSGLLGPVVLRRARGFAPAPFALPAGARDGRPLLCVGGHLKNTIAITVGTGVVVSPHLGDLGSPETLDAFRRTIDLLGGLYGQRYEGVACDAHPDYASTRHAMGLGLPVFPVQHHLAHLLACLLEHGGGPEHVLGVTWDGTGYGSDGTVWGGEFIAFERSRGVARRVAHLRPFRLPGGEAAVREPRRCALALAYDACAGDRSRLRPLARALGFAEAEAELLLRLLELGRHAPVTTSAGRLFDGVAALLGLGGRASFEGQPAMAVECAADSIRGPVDPWRLPIEERDDGRLELDWRPMIRAIWERTADREGGVLAARFHGSLAAAIAAVAGRVSIGSVALSGGCFQNLRLLEETTGALETARFTVLRHRELPPNDGGLSAGQALAVRWGITQVQ